MAPRLYSWYPSAVQLLFFISAICLGILMILALAAALRVGRLKMIIALPRRKKQDHILSIAEPPAPPRPTPDSPRRELQTQAAHEISLRKLPDLRFTSTQPFTRPSEPPPPDPGSQRKPPQSFADHLRERSDWRYFNKDLGDLNDPYQPGLITPGKTNNSAARRRA